MLHSPPKGELFATFHGAFRDPQIETQSMHPPPYGTPPQGMPQGWYPSPFMMPQLQHYLSTPTTAPIHSPAPAPFSSDPPDVDEPNPYPSITNFLEHLTEQQPKRALSRHAAEFDLKDFYQIDELLTLSVEHLSSPEFGMTSGNAQFLWDAVGMEVKQVDRASGRTKKARRA
jgi:hypothetical protein